MIDNNKYDYIRFKIYDLYFFIFDLKHVSVNEKLYYIFGVYLYDMTVMYERDYFNTNINKLLIDHVTKYQELSVDEIVQNKLTYSVEYNLPKLWKDLLLFINKENMSKTLDSKSNGYLEYIENKMKTVLKELNYANNI